MASLYETNPEYRRLFDALKVKYDTAQTDEEASAIARQMQMLNENPNAYVTKAHTKGEEFIGGASKGMAGYWAGKEDFLGMSNLLGGQEQYADYPQSGMEMFGEMVGSLAANPYAFGKRYLTEGLWGAFEGYTAPTKDDNSKILNALLGGGLGLVSRGIGDSANALFDMGGSNKNLSQALRFADKENLPKPRIDDYSDNPLARIGGFLSDDVMVLGNFSKSNRRKKYQNWVDDYVKKSFSGEFDVSSVVNQRSLDLDESTALYNKAFSLQKPGYVPSRQFKTKVAKIVTEMQKLGAFAPKEVRQELQKLLTVAEGDARHWHEVRSIARDLQAKMSQDMTVGRRHINDVVKMLDDVVNAGFTTKAGREAIQNADKFYAQKIPKYYKMKQLSQAIEEENPSLLLKTLIGTEEGIGSVDKVTAQKLWDSVDAEGQDRMVGLIFRNAARYATDEGAKFSPFKFAQYMDKFGERTNIMFDKRTAKNIDGMKKLYGMTRSMESAPSEWLESRTVMPLIGAGFLGGATLFLPESFLSVMGANAGVYFLSRTRPGQAALRQLGRAQNLAEEMRAMQRIGLVFERNPEFLKEQGVDPAEWEAVSKKFEPYIDAAKQYVKDKGSEAKMNAAEFIAMVNNQMRSLAQESKEEAERRRKEAAIASGGIK